MHWNAVFGEVRHTPMAQSQHGPNIINNRASTEGAFTATYLITRHNSTMKNRKRTPTSADHSLAGKVNGTVNSTTITRQAGSGKRGSPGYHAGRIPEALLLLMSGS